MKLVTGFLASGIAILGGYLGFKAYKAIYPSKTTSLTPSTKETTVPTKTTAPASPVVHTVETPITLSPGALEMSCSSIINALSDTEGFKYANTSSDLTSLSAPIIFSMRNWAREAFKLPHDGIAADWLAEEAEKAKLAGAATSYINKILRAEKCFRDPLPVETTSTTSDKFAGFTPGGSGGSVLGVANTQVGALDGVVDGAVVGFWGTHPSLQQATFGKRLP